MSKPLHLVARCAFATFACAIASFIAPSSASAQAIIRDVEIENTLKVYDTPVLRAAGIDPDSVQFHVVQDSSINAFVSNGRNIFVHTGLILAAKNPNEIIGVMAHETGHLLDEHQLRAGENIDVAMRPMLLSIGLGVLAMMAGQPAAGAALIAGSQQFAMGDFVRFTQAQESSADQAGATLLEQSGQSGRGLIEFFNRELRPYEFMTRRLPAWMMTHPYSSDRVESLRRRVEGAAHYDAQDTDDNWRRFKFMQAKLVGFIQTQNQTLAKYPLSDTSEFGRYARAIAYYRVSDFPPAEAELNSLLQEEPNNPYFLELMGQILFESNRAPASVPFYRRSLAQNTHSALFQINLARALDGANAPGSSEESIGLLRQATAEEPDNAFAWREMADVYSNRHQEGLAEWAWAEQSFAVLDCGTAYDFAQRSIRTMGHDGAVAQPIAARRAQDIVDICGEVLRPHDGMTVTPTGGSSRTGRRSG
ncbi:MAG: M48 family metalloprotease [Terricaulis sp.]